MPVSSGRVTFFHMHRQKVLTSRREIDHMRVYSCCCL